MSGAGAIYEAGDQRNEPDTKKGGSLGEENKEFGKDGKPNSHQAQDPKDERSIGNRLANAEPQNETSTSTSGKTLDAETKAGQDDPTAPAKMHGNEPSKGAKIDKELQDEEAELIAKKDAAKAQSKKSK